MPIKEVTEPPSITEAFERTDEAATLTQAAALLILGIQLHGYDRKHSGSVLPSEDLSVLRIPPLPPLGGRIDSQRVRVLLANRFRTSIAAPIPEGDDVTWRPEIFAELASGHVRESSPSSATNLMEACLRHPHEMVRVAAAAAYHEWSSEPDRLKLLLVQGTRSADLLTRELAATALANVNPNDARLTDFQRVSGRAAGAAGAHTALLIHGTFALGASWWQPGGDFHSYLLKKIRPDLYSNSDRFAWSGGYSPTARTLAADDLLRWVASHREEGLDIFTHSHGGSVAMLASTKGLQIGELVLLSCPVHPDDYAPDFNRVKKVVSIRVRLDLVILADMGGQKFADSRIRENILPIWFDHTATHKPSVWQNSTYNIPAML
jgi:hypothetical protein